MVLRPDELEKRVEAQLADEVKKTEERIDAYLLLRLPRLLGLTALSV